MRRFILPGLMLALAAVVAINMAIAQDAEKPKHTIKEVMKAAHGKGKLLEKVTKGEATKEETATLVELYEAMGQNKPPKGDEAAWKAKNEALLQAVKDAQASKEGAAAKLSAASKCTDCHKDHKGPA